MASCLFFAGTLQAQITLTVDAPNDPVDCGDVVTFLIKTGGFTDSVSGLQYSVNWDPSKLIYQGHDSNPGNIFTPGGELPEANVDLTLGQLGLLWADTQAPYNLSIPDGSAILSITFIVRAIGEVGVEFSSVPTEILAQDYDFNDLIVTTEATDVLTIYNPCLINLTVEAPAVDPMDPVVCGDIITYNILVAGFYGYVSTLQFPIQWNPAELEYVSSTFNPSVYASGADDPAIGLQEANVLVYNWGDGLAPFEVSIPDNTVIMSVSFQVKAFGPLPIDISETYPDPGAPFMVAQDLNFTDITVVVDDADAVESTTVCEIDLLVDAPATASCGETITVDIKADGMYSNVSTLQFSVNWDPLQLQYVSSSFDPAVYSPTLDDPLLTHPFSLMPPTGPDGAVIYVWGDLGPEYGVPLADGTVLMTLTFVVVGDGTLNFDITGDPTEIDATDNINFDLIPVNVTGDVITVVDIVAPAITTCPVTLTVEGCNSSAVTNPIFSESFANSTFDEFSGVPNSGVATDACSIVTVIYQDVAAGTCPLVVSRTWMVLDGAGNTASCVQTINIDDTVAPTITGMIAATTVEGCDATAAPAAVTTVSALETLGLSISDACTTDSSLVVASSDASMGTCPIVVSRTYTVTDACGNTSTYTQTINVDDNTAPAITGMIAATTVEGCDATAAPAAVTTVSALETLGLSISDACTTDSSLVVASSDASMGTCPIVVSRTYTVTDACGNTSTYTQTINVDDNTAPAITGMIAATTVEGCDATAAPAAVTTVSALETLGLSISDACTTDSSLVVASSDASVGTCPIVVSRTYTVTDACGNTSTYTQTINVNDTLPPVLIAPDDLILDCGDLADPSAASAAVSDWLNSATATDDCDLEPLVTNAGAAQLDLCTAGPHTVTWTAVDACNNTVTSTRTITIIPAPAGSASGPANICAGQSAVLTATGGVSYAWSTGALTASVTVTPDVTSTYSVGITNLYGCQSQAAVQVTVGGSVPSFSFAGSLPDDPFNGHVVSPSAGSPEDVYRFRVQYAHPDGTAPAPGFPKMQLRYQVGGVPHPNDLALSMNLLPGGDFTSGVVYEAVWAGGLAGGTDWNVQFTTTDPGGCVFTSAVSPALSEPDVLALPDLAVFADDITFSNYNPAPGATVTVYTRVRNQSNYPADNFVVRLRNEFTGADLGTQTVSLAANGQQTLAWTVEMPGMASWNPLRVFADDTDAIAEAYENNNNAIRPIVVGNFPLAGSIETSASAGNIYLGRGCNTLVGSAVYQNLPPATGMNGSSVAGATVIIWLEGGADTLQTTTNSHGYFIFPNAFCSLPLNVGTYTITGIVTDYTVIDTFQTTFEVFNEPIVCLEPNLSVHILGLPNCVFPGSVQDFTITVSNVGVGSAEATTLKVISSSGPPIFIPTPYLPGGTSFQTTIEQTMPGDQQSFSMSAIADAENVLARECYYFDNVFNLSRTPNPEKPNLQVYRINVLPLYYDCQDNIFSVTLHNGSCVSADSSKMRVVVSHLSSGQFWDTVRVVPPMAPEEYLGFSFRDLFPSTLNALGGYRLTVYLDIEEAVAEHNESDNSQSVDFVLDECYADLSAGCGYSYSPVSNYDGTEDVLQIPVRVYNSGLSPQHNDFEVEVQIFENANIIDTISYTETKNMIPGEFAEQTVSFPGLDPCAAEYRVRLRVDTQEEVAERYETNNSCEFHALFRDYLPADNCVTAHFWDYSYPTNEPIQTYASVLKRGDFRDEALDVQFEVRKQGAAIWQSLGTTTIGPLVGFGSEYCPQFGASAPQLITFSSAGIWELRVTVDPADRLCETREENNQIIRAFRVVETPDFEVLSQWIDPETLNPTAGQVITVNASFKNLGKAISTTAPLAVSLKLDQEVVSTINLPSGSFPYNGFTTVSFPNIQMPASYTNGALAQAHVLRVIVDTSDLVVETNELNNEATRLVILDGAPDARVTVLSYANGVISTLVKNFGNSPIVQGVVRLYYTNFFGQEFEIPGAQQIWLGSLVVNGQTARTFSWTAPADAYTLIARVSSVSPAESNDQNNERTLILTPMPLVASATGFPACGNFAEGAAVVSAVSGGIGPFQYLWSTGAVTTGIDSLVAGNYTVTISDAAGATLVRQVVAEQLPGETYYLDTDGDGYGRTDGSLFTCTGAPAGYVLASGDCDDENPDVFPGAQEICNHKDDDCNGLTDDIAGFNGESAPIVACPPSPLILYTNPEAPCEIIVPDYINLLSPVDNCTASDNLTETQSIPAGPYAVSGLGGELTLYYTVSDDETPANETTCVVQITVQDDDAPVVSCPEDAIVNIDATAACQISIPDYVELLSPTDNCTQATDLVETQNIPAGPHAVSGDGATVTIIYTVSDAAAPSNSKVCIVLLTVRDTVKPLITLAGNAEVRICQDQSYTDAGATASDNCDGDLSSAVVVDNPVNPAVPGVYHVRYNISDASGNAAVEKTRTVVVDPKPVISDYSTGVCSGLSGNLQINLSALAGSAPATTFSWITAGNPSVMGEPLSGSASTISSAVVSNITNSEQSVVYTVTPVSDLGCVGEVFNVTVDVYPTPVGNVALNGDLSLCPEEPRLLHGLVTGDQSPYIHTWTVVEETDVNALVNSGAGFVDGPATGDSITLKALSASGGFVKLRHVVSDVNGCLSKATDVRFTIVPNPLPNAIAAGDDTPCPGSTVSYSVSGNAGNTYLWTLSSGGVLLTPTNTDSVNVLWDAVSGGSYLLNLRETNLDGCHTDNSLLIDTLVAPFTLSTTKTDVSCHGGSNGTINLEVSGNLAPFGYDWSNDGAEHPDNDPQDLANLIAGVYTVTVTDASGCSLTMSQTIDQALPLTIASIPADATATGAPPHHNCLTTSDVQGQFTAWLNATPFATSGGVNPLPPTISYAVTDIANNTSVTSAYTSLTPIPAPPADGGYTTVTWTAADACGTISATRTFSVNPCMRISGALRFFRDSSGVQDVAMDMSGASAVDGTSFSTGDYSVYSATSGVYTVTPSKTLLTGTLTPASTLSNVHGINVFDVQAIIAHVGSGTVFTNIYQRVAANVVLGSTSSETNNRLTSADATSLSQAINGSKVQQARLRWRFIPSDVNLLAGAPTTLPRSWGLVPNALAGGLSPAYYGKYLEWRQYDPLTGPLTGQHFTAVRVGDVVPNPPSIGFRYAGAPLVWRVRDQQLHAGETIELVFRADQMSNLTGWQFGLHADPAYLQGMGVSVEPVLSLDPEVHFGMYEAEQGDIRSLWADAERQSLPPGTPVFRLRFRVVQGNQLLSEVLRLDDEVLSCFALNESQSPLGVLLEFESAPGAAATPALRQNTPNPFDKETRVQFDLPTASDILLSIHDVNGVLIKEFSGYYDAGLHELRFGRGDLGQHTGVLFYTLRCGEYTATRRMVLVD